LGDSLSDNRPFAALDVPDRPTIPGGHVFGEIGDHGHVFGYESASCAHCNAARIENGRAGVLASPNKIAQDERADHPVGETFAGIAGMYEYRVVAGVLAAEG